MDMQQFWKLIEDARHQVPDPADGEEVAARAAALLSAYPCEEIVAAEQVLRELMAGSYRTLLWAAAYVINGGCSDPNPRVGQGPVRKIMTIMATIHWERAPLLRWV